MMECQNTIKNKERFKNLSFYLVKYMIKFIYKGEYMKKENKEVKQIPKKNYFIVFVVSILVIITTLYIRSFYLNYQANNSDSSIFYDKKINQIDINDIDYAVNETTDAIMFVSYNGNKSISNMERNLYWDIERKNLNDKILYLNVTEYKDTYIDILKEKFYDIKKEINKAPMLIYIKDGKCVEAFDSSKELINYKTLDTLLSKYGIE